MAEENRQPNDHACVTAEAVRLDERGEPSDQASRTDSRTVATTTTVTANQAVLERIEETLDDISAAAHAATEAVDDEVQRSAALRSLEQHDVFELTVIVPVYNERETLPAVLDRIDEVMPPSTEVIVVDDGSFDGTETWLASLPSRRERKVIRRRGNHGKGSAVRLAIRHSRGRVVAIQDADLEYDPADLLGVVTPILDGSADVVYGSRYLRGCTDRSWVHRLGNWALTRLSNALTGLSLTDMETCHKAFDGNLLRSIELRECRFGFEPEITAKIASRGARISEVPVRYNSRGFDEGKKIGWKDGVAALACMWKYRAQS